MHKIPRIKDIDDLLDVVKKSRSAREATEVFENYFCLYPSNTKTYKQAVANWKDWRKRADAGEVRIGNEWISREEWKRREAESDEKLKEAVQMIAVAAVENAKKLLKETAAQNKLTPKPDFVLGLLNTVADYDLKSARRNFQNCVNRLDQAEQTPMNTANLAAALNNLAVVCVQTREGASALRHWTRCQELLPNQPEVIQNLGRYVNLAGDDILHSPKDLTDKFARLYATAGASTEAIHRRDTGWLLMNYFVEEEIRPMKAGRSSNATLRVCGYGTGFAVHPQYIVTCSHVVNGNKSVQITEPDKPLVKLAAAVVEDDTESDLALIHCKALKLSPLSITTKGVKKRDDCTIIAYQGTVGGSVEGRVLGLPKPRFKDYFEMSAAVRPGLSGGPIVSTTGQVFSVMMLGGIHHGADVAYGVPAKKIVDLVKRQVPSYSSLSAPTLTRTSATRVAQASTVKVGILQMTTDFGLGDHVRRSARDLKANTKVWEQGEFRAFEDRTCSHCSGDKKAKCKNCHRGYIPNWVSRKIGVNPLNGAPIYKKFNEKKKCRTCNGNGRVSCPYCRGRGIDGGLKYR